MINYYYDWAESTLEFVQPVIECSHDDKFYFRFILSEDDINSLEPKDLYALYKKLQKEIAYSKMLTKKLEKIKELCYKKLDKVPDDVKLEIELKDNEYDIFLNE